MERDRQLEGCLLAMRLTTAAFMLVWSVDKILNPKSAQGVFATFYFWKDAPANLLMMFGIAQTLVILAFAAGALRFWTYGAVLLMHLVSTLSSHFRMIPPYGPTANKVFWAAVPVLAGIATLFVLRNRDRLFSVSTWRR